MGGRPFPIGHRPLTGRLQAGAEGDAIAGRSVHLGARVMQHAVDPQLWLSDAAKAALEGESPGLTARMEWVAQEHCELKGVQRTQRLWRAA